MTKQHESKVDVPTDPFERGIEIVAATTSNSYGVDVEIARAIVREAVNYFEVRAAYGEMPLDPEKVAA